MCQPTAESQSDLENAEEAGVPYGSRTRVAAVKGRCPRPLDERDARGEKLLLAVSELTYRSHLLLSNSPEKFICQIVKGGSIEEFVSEINTFVR